MASPRLPATHGPSATPSALSEISPRTRLGASYRSQVSHRIEGTAAFTVPAPLAASPQFQNTLASADLKTPDIVSLAAFHALSPEITLLAEVQWTNWSVVKTLQIERPDGSILSSQPEQWHGTWFGQCRGDLAARPQLDLPRRTGP
jgi:long-chain fatty acid transport protein